MNEPVFNPRVFLIGGLFTLPCPADHSESVEHALARLDQAARHMNPYHVAILHVASADAQAIVTLNRIWMADPSLQLVLYTASSEALWGALSNDLPENHRLLLLTGPLDAVQWKHVIRDLSVKWHVEQALKWQLEERDYQIQQHTADLQAANERLRNEIAQREHMEIELRLAQKLEAVGQLAAGIAHEINTPIQYIGDSVHFLKEAFSDMTSLIEKFQEGFAVLEKHPEYAQLLEDVHEAEETADLEYVKENIPRAFERTLEGIAHVTGIVRAMKEFAHPDQREKNPSDLNKAIGNTLIVSRNEYKYVADIETHLGDIPLVACYLSDLNQVFLNLVVNAAHAITGVVRGTTQRGKITITSCLVDDFVEITIADTGGGIPEAIRERIYDPFFTTKPVGEGSGQGLAIARSIVVDKHQGSLSFDSVMGEGTTFYIRLPIA